MFLPFEFMKVSSLRKFFSKFAKISGLEVGFFAMILIKVIYINIKFINKKTRCHQLK